MISRKLVPLIAVAIIALMFIPQYASATSYSPNLTTIQMDSEHASSYDKLVNVANNSALENQDTWDPAPQGIWIGGSTEESSLRLGPIFTVTSTILLTWEFSLTSNQIMSGAGGWTMRFPFDTTDVGAWTFNLYQIPSSKCYFTEMNGADASLNFTSPVYQICGDASGGYNPLYSDGDAYWVNDARAYLRVNAPIIPGNIYLAEWQITPIVDGRVVVFLSPNDVCSDENLNSSISWSVAIAPLTYDFARNNLTLDLGCSFDMNQGLGNGAMYVDKYIAAGDMVWFWVWANVNNTNVYHTINLPVYSQAGETRWEINVYNADSLALLWSNPATTYYGAIIQCSAATIDLSLNNTIKFLFITMESSWSQNIRFVLGDKPNIDDGLFGRSYNVEGNATEILGTSGQFFNLGPIVTYHLSTMAIPTPDVNPNNPWPQLQTFIQKDVWSDVWVFLINLGITVGMGGLPFPFLVHNQAGDTMGDVVFKDLMALANFGVGVYGTIAGMLRNTIDAIWGTLVAIGDFIWSVGEWLYDAILWLADAVMEFGAIVLGLLAIFVIIIIFFFAIWFQLKIYSIFLKLAQGDTRGAMKEGQELASTIEKGAGKVI
jgi:hypothetical protein